MREALWRLCGEDLTRIDGISSRIALTVLTEVGADLSAFPDEHHFVSWLRLSPKMAFSAGKALKKRRNGLGASRVAAVLRMGALTLQKTSTALGACYRRTARRKSGRLAVFVVARKLAILIYRMLRYGNGYVDIGAKRYEARFAQRRIRSLKSNAQSLGYKLVPLEAPTALARVA